MGGEPSQAADLLLGLDLWPWELLLAGSHFPDFEVSRPACRALMRFSKESNIERGVLVNPPKCPITAIAIDPMLPRVQLNPNPWTQARFRRRWKRWEPWALIHLKQKGLPLSTISQMEEQHRDVLLRSLRLGVNSHNLIDILERGQIDDPRVAPEERERRLQAHLNQRTRKLRREVRSWNNKGERWQKGERWPGWAKGRSCP